MNAAKTQKLYHYAVQYIKFHKTTKESSVRKVPYKFSISNSSPSPLIEVS
jgi:hypothetical protein